MDVDLTFSLSELGGGQMSHMVVAALGTKAYEAANDASTFSKRPERVRTFRSMTPPGEAPSVRQENTGDE